MVLFLQARRSLQDRSESACLGWSVRNIAILVRAESQLRPKMSYEATIDQLVKHAVVWIGPNPTSGSVVPDDRYATKCATLDRHVGEGRERQMSGHQKLARRRQLP